MNKGELVDALYNSEGLGLTRKEVDAAVKSFVDIVTKELVAGNTVNITGFFKLSPRKRPARVARNPLKPGETVNVPERVGVSFKAGKSLKDALNA